MIDLAKVRKNPFAIAAHSRMSVAGQRNIASVGFVFRHAVSKRYEK